MEVEKYAHLKFKPAKEEIVKDFKVDELDADSDL